MKTPKGEEAFDLFFSQVYGEGWKALKEKLLEEPVKLGRRNLFYLEEPPQGKGVLELCSSEEVGHCYHLNSEFDLKNYSSLIMPYYRMDPASIYPAQMLDPQPGESVLDLCAAPGGKTLVLAEKMFAGQDLQGELQGLLVANELSPKRRFRMMSVFKNYLPAEVRRKIKILGMDGSRIGLQQKEKFDRILLDAPCSGERELLHKSAGLKDWKEKRSKNFGVRQYALLASAFMSLKPGGTLVYSTCSISPHENDGVLDKLQKRKEGEFISIPSPYQAGEETKWGRIILPTYQGWGPIYFAAIKKL